MCHKLHVPVSDKSFPPRTPPPSFRPTFSSPSPPHPLSPPPHPKKNHTCNVTTASKCGIFDKLQEKIRSIASRPAQKVTGKSSEQEHQERVTSCMCLRVSDKSFPPRPPHPPSPPPRSFVDSGCETFQASCNVPGILQRANYLATSQHLLNAPSVTSYKRKFGA